MNIRKLLTWLTAVVLSAALVLTGCTPASTSPTPGGAEDVADYMLAASRFPLDAPNTNASVSGGVLKVALVTASTFAGSLNPVWYQDNYDSQLLGWFTEGVLSADEDFVYDQDGPATYTYDVASKTITIKLQDGIKWHDGTPFTLDDLVYAHEVICHPDYDGMRYGQQFTNIVGVEDYHNGTADTISGLALSEDKMELTISFIEFFPSILVGGIWTSPIPRHYYGDIPVKEMAGHAKTRQTPIGYGPYKVKNIVPGESVEFERYDDYWRGAPKLDGVIVSVVNQELVPTAMREGTYDIAQFSVQAYPDYKEPTNYSYVGQIQTVFSYTGFKMGKWDQTNSTNIYDPNAKMANVKLRQAIGYAVDNKTLGETMYNGLRFPATTVITPRHASYQNKDIDGYIYNPELSKQLLDEAGYKDVDGDGLREDPEGKPFVITWATMEGEGAETIANFKMQAWKDVGLNVKLYNDRLTEFNAFYDAVEFDDPAIDMYDGAWQTGFDPNPDNLWGHSSSANYTRYTSDTLDAVIADISSEAAWDGDYLSEKYQEFQRLFFEEAPVVPTLWRMGLEAVNHRVKNYRLVSVDVEMILHLIELTSDTPEVG